MTIPSNAAYVYEARAQVDGDIVAVDDCEAVSRADDLSGAWVRAWVWIEADSARAAQKVMP